MKIEEVDKDELSLLGLKGRPKDYTFAREYPAIKGALAGKIMCIECKTEKEALAAYNRAYQVNMRNKLQLILTIRKNKVYVYKKSEATGK